MARLSVENVSVDFGGIHALRDVSFELESGAIVGLIGPNGAGKSTLLNCVSGITRPTRGQVRLDDAVLSALPPATVAGCGIGRVFQHPELVVDLPVRENLLIACHRSLGYGLVSELLKLPNVWAAERAAARRVDDVLERLGLSDSAELAIRNLPYGHRKLVDLGRALLMDIRFLLLDEPIAGLNDAEVAQAPRFAASAAPGIGSRHSRRRAQYAVRLRSLRSPGRARSRPSSSPMGRRSMSCAIPR